MPRDTLLKKTLFACDELSGFVHACGLVRPTGLEGLEPKSVRKKLKQPSFAAGVHRDEVYKGAEELGIELDEHIRNVVAALQPIAGELGLRTSESTGLVPFAHVCPGHVWGQTPDMAESVTRPRPARRCRPKRTTRAGGARCPDRGRRAAAERRRRETMAWAGGARPGGSCSRASRAGSVQRPARTGLSAM